ncbi:hypothetical protein Tco_1371595 [Tanacetum coccineum]
MQLAYPGISRVIDAHNHGLHNLHLQLFDHTELGVLQFALNLRKCEEDEELERLIQKYSVVVHYTQVAFRCWSVSVASNIDLVKIDGVFESDTGLYMEHIQAPNAPFVDVQAGEQKILRSVVWAFLGTIYLSYAMLEVYRVLFEVFGLDPKAEECQPKLRRELEDVDYVSEEFEGINSNWLTSSRLMRNGRLKQCSCLSKNRWRSWWWR